MSIVNKPNTFSGNTTISSSEVNSNFDTIYNEFNGSISSANLVDDAVTAAKLADNAVVTANITDAAVTPAKLLAGTGSSWAWQSWTPTWTNFTVGNGTVTAKYVQIGKTVHVRLSVSLGTTSSMGTEPQFTLPVTSVAYPTTETIFAPAYITDFATVAYTGYLRYKDTTKAGFVVSLTNGTYGQLTHITSTVPMTWTNQDEIGCVFSYEAA